MATVVLTVKLSPYPNPIDHTAALLVIYAGTIDEKINLQGIAGLLSLDESVAVMYSRTALDARIAAI